MNIDGMDHINIYSKGKTELGKLLSNFADTPFTCEDGKFRTLEGYWYYLSCTHFEKDKLRKTSGYESKILGRNLRSRDWCKSEDFRNKIIKAMVCKIRDNKHIAKLLKESSLPFKHYYIYNNKIKVVDNAKWILEAWETIRIKLKEL